MLDPKSDQIIVQSLSKEFEDTKRGLLSCVSSIFDLLGIVNLELLEAILLREKNLGNDNYNGKIGFQ